MQGASGPQTFMPPDYVDPYVTDGDTSELDAIQVSLRGEDGGSFPLKGTTCCEPRWPAQAAARQRRCRHSTDGVDLRLSCSQKAFMHASEAPDVRSAPWTCSGEACRG